jgi:DNA-binding XRE family transcriptional regulator
MKIEVRALGLKTMREKMGLTQRKLAHDLGINPKLHSAIEANTRQAGPKL